MWQSICVQLLLQSLVIPCGYSPSLVLVVPSTAPDTPVSSSANANNTALCLLVNLLREEMNKIQTRINTSIPHKNIPHTKNKGTSVEATIQAKILGPPILNAT